MAHWLSRRSLSSSRSLPPTSWRHHTVWLLVWCHVEARLTYESMGPVIGHFGQDQNGMGSLPTAGQV